MNNKKPFILFFVTGVLFFSICANPATKGIVLEKTINLADLEIYKPQQLQVTADYIYLYDDATHSFFILDKDSKIKGRFGKRGEGPAEILYIAGFGILKNRVWVDDFGRKISWFNLEGKLLSETPNRFVKNEKMMDVFIDEKRNISIEYISESPLEIKKIVYFNEGFLKIKLVEINQSLNKKIDLEKNSLSLNFAAGKKWVYFVPDANFYKIDRLNIKTHSISGAVDIKNYKRETYSEKEKEEFKERIKKVKERSPILSNIKVRIPGVKSAIKDIYADNEDNLYVLTNKKNNHLSIMDIYDKNLKFKQNILLPPSGIHYIANNRIYIVFSDDEEDAYFLSVYRLDLEKK